MRKVLVMVEVDEEKYDAVDMGAIGYVEQEFGWLEESGIFAGDMRILDDDDPYDYQALKIVDCIFEGV